jgi:hypothetical protein
LRGLSSADLISVERRFDSRYPAELAIWVTDLARSGHSAAGTIRDISNSGVCVVSALPLGPGDTVRLDVGDCVLFGLVTYATPEEAGWRSGIEVQQALLGDSELSQLLQQVLQETMPAVEQGSLL